MTETPSQLNARRVADRHKTRVGQRRKVLAYIGEKTAKVVRQHQRGRPAELCMDELRMTVEAFEEELR